MSVYEIDWGNHKDWVLAESPEAAVAYCVDLYGLKAQNGDDVPESVRMVSSEEAASTRVGCEDDPKFSETLATLAADGPGPSVLASTEV